MIKKLSKLVFFNNFVEKQIVKYNPNREILRVCDIKIYLPFYTAAEMLKQNHRLSKNKKGQIVDQDNNSLHSLVCKYASNKEYQKYLYFNGYLELYNVRKVAA